MVVTHSLRIAAQLAEAPHISVNVVGGNLRPQELALVGPDTRRALEAYSCRQGVHGVCWILTRAGRYRLRRPRSRSETGDGRVGGERDLLADHTKWKRSSLVAYAGLSRFAAVVSDANLPVEARDYLRGLGVEVVVAECDPPKTHSDRNHHLKQEGPPCH